MKIFTSNPLQSLVQIRCLQSSGRALNVFLGHICPKCSKKNEGTSSESQTTSCTCLQRLFAPSSNDSEAVASNNGHTEVLNSLPDENGFTPSSLSDDSEKSVSVTEHPRKSSVHHRLKIWIGSGHNGIMGRHGNKLDIGIPKKSTAEHDNPEWPDWLVNVAPEAVQGWYPQHLDSFEKSEKIGQGTYSNVYKARDLRTGKLVALKKVHFVIEDPESVCFMAREIVILRKLSHPNIIKLEGVITSSDSRSLYLSFEYMEHDLVGLAATPGLKFSEAQIKCLLQQLLSGLDHCHSNGVLHRDMKASNVLIDSDGVLKIADFGLATSYDPDNQQPQTSRVATLWYRPPELLLGATKYGPSVDMWSTGCIFAELLAGQPILPGRTEVEQIHKIFKLCGSPCDEYWNKLELPQTGIFKPSRQYRRCLVETFKGFPPSALVLLDNLLSLEPEARGTAASTLQSDFFRAEPLACSPSTLPKCPPSKEYDARLRREEARRQRVARESESVVLGNGISKLSRTGNVSIKLKELEAITTNTNSANLSSEQILATEIDTTTWNSRADTVDHPEVPGLGTVGPAMIPRDKSKRFKHSGSMITAKGNIEHMLKEHERNIQEAVRKARINKSREL